VSAATLRTGSKGRKPDIAAVEATTKRCAIYMRTATKNASGASVDDQRESCAAHAKGQGWNVVGTYDDGGFSGANINRPGLRRLHVEVDAGRVDVVVVHTVDRLSRSLVHLAWVVKRLTRAGVSFVSVTKSFSTAQAGRNT